MKTELVRADDRSDTLTARAQTCRRVLFFMRKKKPSQEGFLRGLKRSGQVAVRCSHGDGQ